MANNNNVYDIKDGSQSDGIRSLVTNSSNVCDTNFSSQKTHRLPETCFTGSTYFICYKLKCNEPLKSLKVAFIARQKSSKQSLCCQVFWNLFTLASFCLRSVPRSQQCSHPLLCTCSGQKLHNVQHLCSACLLVDHSWG